MSLPYILMLSATTEDNLSISMDTTTPLGERLSIGLQTMVLGLLIVFIVLMILWGVLELFRIIFYKPNKIGKEEITEEPTIIETETFVIEEATDGNELIAVISAAVTAYMNDTTNDTTSPSVPDTKFKVVSFKKVK